jgi:hypothetical protein
MYKSAWTHKSDKTEAKPIGNRYPAYINIRLCKYPDQIPILEGGVLCKYPDQIPILEGGVLCKYPDQIPVLEGGGLSYSTLVRSSLIYLTST